MADGKGGLKQFWPEFTQDSYIEAFSLQESLLDYTAANLLTTTITARQREGIVDLMHGLNKHKKYRKETLYVAIGLLDRYLDRWLRSAQDGEQQLDLIMLGTVCVLLAAKLNQPVHPCFDNMIMLLDEPYASDGKTKQKLIELEFRVVQLL